MRIVISGGGTGGHIYPALAYIRHVKENHPNCQFLYIGTKEGLESKIVPRENIPFETIHITGFKRKLSFDNVKTIARFLKGVRDSKKILKEFQPDIVIGTGGYVCGPVVYAAHKLKIPTIIHEQNSIPGLTNKFLSKYVSKIAISFPESEPFFPKEKVVLTGNPRGSEVLGKDGYLAKQSIGLKKDKNSILIFGGSRGARPINDAVIEMIPIVKERDYQLLYITGEVHYNDVIQKVEKNGSIPENVKILPFLHNMPEVLAGMDLVVARAGATTIAELTSLGVPSILIPSPYVTNNHQEKNARALVENNAAKMLLEKDLTGKTLINEIDTIIHHKEKLEEMKEASKKLGIKDASNRLYELSISLVKHES